MLARIGLVLLLLLAWLVVLLPMKAVALMAGGAPRLGYSDVFGTVWDSRVYGLMLQGQPVRETAIGVRPAALFSGRLAADIRLEDPHVSGAGRVSLAPGSRWTLEEASLSATLDRLGLGELPGLDPQERIFFRVVRLELEAGRCREAVGTARSGALVSLASSYGQVGPALVGELSCRGEALVLSFSGEEAALSLSGEAVLRADGYDWHIDAQTRDAALADILVLAGFTRTADGWQAEGSADHVARD
jgi:general secretion pathway protein N